MLSDTDFSYSVVIDGVEHVIYKNSDEGNYNWGMGVTAVIKIVDDLLIKINDENRLYFSWSGDNGINFFLLTDALYEYISINNIDGGLGRIVKSVEAVG